jgi:hypothetical protein
LVLGFVIGISAFDVTKHDDFMNLESYMKASTGPAFLGMSSVGLTLSTMDTEYSPPTACILRNILRRSDSDLDLHQSVHHHIRNGWHIIKHNYHHLPSSRLSLTMDYEHNIYQQSHFAELFGPIIISFPSSGII